MRKLWMLTVALPLGVLPACAVEQTASTAGYPMVSYAYDDDDDYETVAKRADLHCEEEFGRDAVVVDRDEDGTRYHATFRCE